MALTRQQWEAKLKSLSPDALASLRAKLRPASLSRWITKNVPRHAPIPPHLARLVAILERAEREPVRLLVSMPPRHAKSVTVLAALAWLIDKHPGRLNAYTTYSTDKAKAKSRIARRMALKANVALDPLVNSAHEWRTPQGGGLLAAGVEKGLTGEGIDGLLVVDDPFKGRAEAESPAQRRKVFEWFNDVAYTRLNPGASIVVLATRWHHDDLIGRLADMKRLEDGRDWEVINFPAVRDTVDLEGCEPADEGFALWPERYPLSELRTIRRQVLEYSWASLYQGRPVAKGGSVFDAPTRHMQAHPSGGKIILAVDPAGTASTKSDHTSAVALLFFADKTQDKLHKAYVLEVLSFQADNADAASKLLAFQKRWGSAPLGYEATRDGHAIAKALMKVNAHLKLIPIAPRGDKLVRATPVAAAWNDGRIFVPMHGDWLDEFLHVVSKFTGVGDARDDEVDALAHAWNLACGTAPVVGAKPEAVGTDRYATEGFAPRYGTGDDPRQPRGGFWG